MSSLPGALFEDWLQCPICLSVFTEPVFMPCGHNFCKSCIRGFWTNQTERQCPCCWETCRPAEIRVNTGLRDIVDHFKSRAAEVGSEARPGEVLCDVCPGSKHKALKTCLVCLVSYCYFHLEPHHRVPSLMKHQLQEPLANLADHVCQKHHKVFELFCRNDQVSICVLCLKEEHLNHKTVSLKEEVVGRKICLGNVMLQVKQEGEHKAVEIQEANRSSKERSRAVQEDTQESVALLQGLVVSTQAYMVQMLKVMRERQRSEEMKVTYLVKKLNLELAELQQKSKELEALSQTKDPQLLGCSSASWLPLTYYSPPSGTQQPLCAAEVETVVERVEQTLSREMQRILGVEEDELKVQQEHWVEVELDTDTAHPCLVLSLDEKVVREGQLATQNLPSNPKRSDFHHWFLAQNSYSSGCFYFQVEVGAKKGWAIGVVRDSIKSKGLCFNLMPEDGTWSLSLYQGRYQANTSPPTALYLGHQPQTVGVSVDYDKGSVSFYDVDTRNLIYCFSSCTFNASLFSRVPYDPRTSIYPFFSQRSSSDDGDLTISPVQQGKRSPASAPPPPSGQSGARGPADHAFAPPPPPGQSGARGPADHAFAPPPPSGQSGARGPADHAFAPPPPSGQSGARGPADHAFAPPPPSGQSGARGPVDHAFASPSTPACQPQSRRGRPRPRGRPKKR